jgi:hypothetical protein
VGVVAARVHAARVDRGIGQIGLLGNRQPVDVRPKQPPIRRRIHGHVDDQPSPVLPDLDLRAPRPRGRAGFDLAPHDGERLLLLEAQLRDPVKLFPEFQDVRFRLARERRQRGRHARPSRDEWLAHWGEDLRPRARWWS